MSNPSVPMSTEDKPETTEEFLPPTLFQDWSRLQSLEESDVRRVSGSEGFYCTACNVHISHIDTAETHVISRYHRNNLRAIRLDAIKQDLARMEEDPVPSISHVSAEQLSAISPLQEAAAAAASAAGLPWAQEVLQQHKLQRQQQTEEPIPPSSRVKDDDPDPSQDFFIFERG